MSAQDNCQVGEHYQPQDMSMCAVAEGLCFLATKPWVLCAQHSPVEMPAPGPEFLDASLQRPPWLLIEKGRERVQSSVLQQKE